MAAQVQFRFMKHPQQGVCWGVPARCQRTRVSGRMIGTALRTDGNHRYSWTKNKRSLFVNWTRPRTLRCNTIS